MTKHLKAKDLGMPLADRIVGTREEIQHQHSCTLSSLNKQPVAKTIPHKQAFTENSNKD